MTLNCLMAVNLRYFTEFGKLEAYYIKVVEVSHKNVAHKI